MSTQQQKRFNILLIGDSGVDEYRFGTVTRLSPEAPVPIFNFVSKEIRPGMAANVRDNLLALECKLNCFLGPESIKTRLIDLKSNQHILRIDKDAKISIPLNVSYINFSGVDAVAISDYDKGYVTRELIDNITNAFNGPIFLDTKKPDLGSFNCFVKVNEYEFAGRTSEPKNAIVTLGKEGAIWNNKKFSTRKVDVNDVCGAGDTFFASLIYFYLHGDKNMEYAIEYANRASSITVQHIGTYAPTLKEIYETIR